MHMRPAGSSNFFAAPRAASAAIVAVTMALPFHGNAESTRVRINIMGLGAEPCEVIESGRISKEDINHWVEGFWSGLNYVAAASQQKQSIVDRAAIMAEVEKVCRRSPSQILATAAWTAFLALNQK
jgi:hypothetical protein